MTVVRDAILLVFCFCALMTLVQAESVTPQPKVIGTKAKGHGDNPSASPEFLCDTVKNLTPAELEMPTDQDGVRLAKCKAEDLYYGIGIKKDFVEARKCALQENDSRVLSMVYANGEGVTRNLDLAIHYACEAESAAAELEFRVNHLLRMKKEANPKHFDFCDDITSGIMQNYCATLEKDIQRSNHDRATADLAAKWNQQTKDAFAKLKAQSEEFYKLETDWIEATTEWAGTGASARYESQLTELESDFQKQLLFIEKNGPPKLSPEGLGATDAALNKSYREAMRREDPNSQTTTKESNLRKSALKAAELKWIRYRDAWAKFGVARFPQSKEAAWIDWVSKERIKQLESHQVELVAENKRGSPIDCTGGDVDTSPKVVLGDQQGKDDSTLYPSWKEAGSKEKISGHLPPGTLVGVEGEPNHPGKNGKDQFTCVRRWLPEKKATSQSIIGFVPMNLARCRLTQKKSTRAWRVT